MRIVVSDGEGLDRGIRTLTLARPEVRNAFDRRGYDALAAALHAAGEHDDVAVVVLAAQGAAFCAGADVTEWRTGDMATFTDAFRRLVQVLACFPKPLLAAVQGPAVGFGATMLAYADLVFAAASARFRFPFSALGTVPEAGSSTTVPERLGAQEAFWTLVAGPWLTATEAHARGLVWNVVDDATLVDTVREHARILAGYRADVVQAAKALLVAGRPERVMAALERELAAGAALPRQSGRTS